MFKFSFSAFLLTLIIMSELSFANDIRKVIKLSPQAQQVIDSDICGWPLAEAAAGFQVDQAIEFGVDLPETFDIELISGSQSRSNYIVEFNEAYFDVKRLAIRVRISDQTCTVRVIEPEIVHELR